MEYWGNTHTHKRTCKLERQDNGCINEKNEVLGSGRGNEGLYWRRGEERTIHFASDRGRHRRQSGGGDYREKDDLLRSLIFPPLSFYPLLQCRGGEERSIDGGGSRSTA